jgi:hypothetical protein
MSSNTQKVFAVTHCNSRVERLLEVLHNQGFYRSGNRLVAPHATLWLSYEALPYTDLEVLEREAARRLGRARRLRRAHYSPHDWDCAIEDAEALLEALGEVVRATWQALPRAS